MSTALLHGAAVLILASLTLPSTTPCELRLDACVLFLRTTFLFLQAYNQLLLAQMGHGLLCGL